MWCNISYLIVFNFGIRLKATNYMQQERLRQYGVKHDTQIFI